jgi:hypothetical protein
MSEPRLAKRPRLEIQGSFEVIEREADPCVMNWAVNRYCEWLLRRYLERHSQAVEKNGRL